MVQLTPEQRTFVIEMFYETNSLQQARVFNSQRWKNVTRLYLGSESLQSISNDYRQFILPLTHQGDLLDFFILRRVDECQEPFTKTPILHQLLNNVLFEFLREV
jgi:hypothetical protein